MISQSSSNFPLPRHFNFDSLANKKKVNTTVASQQIQQSQPQIQQLNNDFPSRKPNFLTSKILEENSQSMQNSLMSKQSKADSSKSSKSSKFSKSSKSESRGRHHYYSSDEYSSSSSESDKSDDEPFVFSKHRRSSNSSNSSDKSKNSHSENSRSFKDKYDVNMGGLKENPMTEEEYRMKQIDLIMALRQFKEDGIPVDESVALTQSTPLPKLQFAYDFAMRYVARKATFEQMQQGLTLGSQLIEMGNKVLKGRTGYGAELDGWGQSVIMNMPKFNRPLQRLAEKYSKADSEQSPELQLAMAVGYSAFTFHFAKKMSIDPQVAMQFMDYMQQSNQGGSNQIQSQGVPLNQMGNNINNYSSTTESPMGMRPPLPRNTRTPINNNDDDDVLSERTESVSVDI
jgi:hypothetical protein